MIIYVNAAKGYRLYKLFLPSLEGFNWMAKKAASVATRVQPTHSLTHYVDVPIAIAFSVIHRFLFGVNDPGTHYDQFEKREKIHHGIARHEMRGSSVVHVSISSWHCFLPLTIEIIIAKGSGLDHIRRRS